MISDLTFPALFLLIFSCCRGAENSGGWEGQQAEDSPSESQERSHRCSQAGKDHISVSCTGSQTLKLNGFFFSAIWRKSKCQQHAQFAYCDYFPNVSRFLNFLRAFHLFIYVFFLFFFFGLTRYDKSGHKLQSQVFSNLWFQCFMNSVAGSIWSKGRFVDIRSAWSPYKSSFLWEKSSDSNAMSWLFQQTEQKSSEAHLQGKLENSSQQLEDFKVSYIALVSEMSIIHG